MGKTPPGIGHQNAERGKSLREERTYGIQDQQVYQCGKG